MKKGRIREVVMPPIENKFTAPVRWAKTWEELKYTEGLYVCGNKQISDGKNLFATKEQAEQYGIVAAQLSQLVAQLNGEPNWKPEMGEKYYYIVPNDVLAWNCFYKCEFSMIHFPLKTQAAAEFTIKHHADLWRKFHGLS